MPRYALKIEYSGEPFKGWQRQPTLPTVQGAIEDALRNLQPDHEGIQGAGRTDTGVHATGQVAHIDMDEVWDPFRLSEALNFHLRFKPVSILAAANVPDDFHARFGAEERRYTFRLFCRRAPLTFAKGTMWQIKHHLDVRAMREAAHYLIGKHDFTTFRSSICQAASPIKTLNELRIETSAHSGGTEIRFHIRARSFLHNQVRSFVGTLERVGSGAWTPEDVLKALEARDRTACGPVCPPQGLYLADVRYPIDPFNKMHLPLEPIKHLASGIGATMLEQMPLPLLVITRKGRVAHANQSAFDLLPNLRMRQHFSGIFDSEAFIGAVNEAIEYGKTGKIKFRTTSSGERHFNAHIGLLPAGSEFGKTIRVIVAIEERTLVRKAEQMRSDFIANVSHELRTPLASILGYVETLQGHAKDDPVAREMFLKTMAQQAGRMQNLVNDLMSLNRIEQNEHKTPREICSLNALVAEAVTIVQPSREKYGAELEIDLTPDMPAIAGDRDQLIQVLVNLIENAMKYADAGKTSRVITAAASKDFPGMVGITIQDEGPGIAAEHIPRLTERFYRVSVAKSREKGGTGLGLAIVKHIMNRHEGTLAIESQVGIGSAFTIWIPVLQQGLGPVIRKLNKR
ncbi:MAG: tRNA pseudouridine(38-40) synthase TruA [Rhodobacteraceae bacterium]|nr:tRNA pseudouridine(38-40) synthase TruA [Paracoccaceae bacterium]